MSNVIHHSWVLSNFDLRLAIKTIWEAKCGPMCKWKPAGPLKFWRIARTGNLHLFSDSYWRTVRGAEIRLIIFHFFGTLNHILGYWVLTVPGEDLSTAVFGNVPNKPFCVQRVECFQKITVITIADEVILHGPDNQPPRLNTISVCRLWDDWRWSPWPVFRDARLLGPLVDLNSPYYLLSGA